MQQSHEHVLVIHLLIIIIWQILQTQQWTRWSSRKMGLFEVNIHIEIQIEVEIEADTDGVLIRRVRNK